jgi:hypothetical protein
MQNIYEASIDDTAVYSVVLVVVVCWVHIICMSTVIVHTKMKRREYKGLRSITMIEFLVSLSYFP